MSKSKRGSSVALRHLAVVLVVVLLPATLWSRSAIPVSRRSLTGTVPSPGSRTEPSTPRRSADIRGRIDSFVTARAAQDSFSGVVALAKNGTIVYRRAAGMANRARGTPMAFDTKLQIASITKLYTQIAVLQLEQAGKLSLSDTVGKFLPDYPNATVRSKVTVEQLLHHRSGVGSFWNAAFMSRHAQIHTVSEYLTLFDRDSLLFDPGTKEEYSNGGYVLLGAIIERASGQSYHDYVRMHIFQPAGMTSTMPYDNRRVIANAAIGYTRQSLDVPMLGDSRHAGAGPRPGYGQAPTPGPVLLQPPPQPPSAGGDPPTPAPGMRLRIIGADGHELSPDEARKAVAEHTAEGGALHPNTATEAGTSGPAGDDYSTAADFIRLARALVSHHLLDSARTSTLLGARYRAGGDFRVGGGGPGVNAEFSLFPSGDVVVVLSNYDPPAATTIARFIRSLLAMNSPPSP